LLAAVEIEQGRPYDLRHSFASLLLHEGRSVHYVAKQLGHGARLTLDTYGHVIDELEDVPRLAAVDAILHARAGSSAQPLGRGLDRIVELMSAIRPIGTREREHGNRAISGPPTCRARLPQVVSPFRRRRDLQPFSTVLSVGHDCPLLRASLIRNRSQVRVLDRP
jgi:hypothetical protein